MRPVTHNSTKQSPLETELHQCAQAINCVIWAVEVLGPITVMGTKDVPSPHSIVQLLKTGKSRAVSESRTAKLESMLLPVDKHL